MRVILLFCLLLAALPAAAQTITDSVTWSGERHIEEKIRVEKGGHLRITPGSRLVFAGGSLEVAGRLSAREVSFAGDDWAGLVLKGCTTETLIADSRVSGARIGIQVIGGEPRLEGVTLSANEIGVELRRQSRATVAGSVFSSNSKVGLFVKDGSTAAIVNNRFEKNGKFGAYIFRSTPRRFDGNFFSGESTALMIAYAGSNPELNDNCFDTNRTAIRVEKGARPLIKTSDISGNGVGISLYRRADPRIEKNRLMSNETAIAVAYSSYPQIHANDFIGNGKALFLEYQSSRWELTKGAATRKNESSRSAFANLEKSAVELAAPGELDGTVDARNNWWGTAGTAELAEVGADGNPSFIDDGRDRPTFVEAGVTYPLDTVVFTPWQHKANFAGEERP